MAITSMDQAVQALAAANRLPVHKTALGITPAAGEYYSLFAAGGRPAAGSLPAVTVQEIPTSSTTGAITPWVNPVGGRLSYLMRALLSATQPGTIVLFDRLWHGSFNGVTLATTTFTVPTGTVRLAAGEGAELWLEHTATTTTGAGALTVTYTNQAGSTGRTVAGFAPPSTTPRTSVTEPVLPLSTSGGVVDTGVRRVESVQVTASTGSANLALTMLRRLAEFPVSSANIGQLQEMFASGLPTIGDSACLMLAFLQSNTTAPVISGSLAVGNG